MKYISAKGLSAAVVRKCLIRTSVQTARPFYFGQLLRPHGIKSGIRKNIRASFVRGGKEQPMAVTVRRLCRFAGHYINAGICGSTFSLYAECDFVE